jgi:hypothetical protein
MLRFEMHSHSVALIQANVLLLYMVTYVSHLFRPHIEAVYYSEARRRRAGGARKLCALSANWQGRCAHAYECVNLGRRERGAGAPRAHASARMRAWLTSTPAQARPPPPRRSQSAACQIPRALRQALGRAHARARLQARVSEGQRDQGRTQVRRAG